MTPPTPRHAPSERVLTVAIPTYNGAKRFPEVLEALLLQTGIADLSWEVLLIDNASTDETAQVLRDWQSRWTAEIPLRYHRENRPGLAYARLAAAREAHGAILGFLDDDNLPNPDWVAQAVSFGRDHPKAGAWAGRIAPEYECEPPPHFERIVAYMAITQLGREAFPFPIQGMLPPGAGLVVRRDAWIDCVPSNPYFSGRLKDSRGRLTYRGSSAEDLEALIHLARGGWEIWYSPGMNLLHRISAGRFERDYLIDMFLGIGKTRYYTRKLRYSAWKWPFLAPAYFLNDIRKWARHCWQYRFAAPDDVVVIAERKIYSGAIASPFLHWKSVLFGPG